MPTKTKPIVTLFSAAEHAVLAKWFNVEPLPEVAGLDCDTALAELGFRERPSAIYTLESAATAHILLESAEGRLPQWALVDCSAKTAQPIIFARPYRDPVGKPLRKVSVASRSLFTINWADSGPGYSWPVEYRLVWVPFYERWVVTASADSTDAHGYCDFALGSFSRNEPTEETVGSIIKRDWSSQLSEYGQERWAYLFDNSMANKKLASRWADEVWDPEWKAIGEDGTEETKK